MTARSRLRGGALMILMVGALLLGSCSTAPPSPVASETSTAATKPYGRLTIQVRSIGAGMDPNMIGSSASYNPVEAAVFDSLIELTTEGLPRPGIAERWEISPDGKTHTFYIRKGVKFHDGSDLTGADAKFSLERVTYPDSTKSDAPYWRTVVAGVDLIDSYTVALRLKAPHFEWLRGFGDFAGSPAVVPKKYIEEKGVEYFRQHPVGSGPWKVLSQEYGARVELEAFEEHWRAVPKFKNLTLLTVNEESTRIAMLKTGELDMAEVAPDTVPGLKSAGIRILSYSGGSNFAILFSYDLDHPEQYPLGDVRVRKALSLAINRQEMADKLYGGFGEPSVIWMIPKTAYYMDPNVLKPDPYDPEQAKRLLVEAGYPNGFNMTMWHNTSMAGTGIFNTAIVEYWRKVGVNAKMDSRDTLPRFGTPDVYNSAYGYLASGASFGFEKMVTVYHSTTVIKNINNPKLDELIGKVLATLDPAEKKRTATEAAVMARNQYIDPGVIYLDTILAFGPKIGGMTTIAGMQTNAYNFVTITHAK